MPLTLPRALIAIVVVGAIVAAIGWFGRPDLAAGGGGTIIVVDTVIDENESNSSCSLREAIVASNNDANYRGCIALGAGEDLIEFSLGPGTPTIALTSQLPAIGDAVVIDGGPNRVEIRGPGNGFGFFVSSDFVSLLRLVINNFNIGIQVYESSNVTIAGSYIGTNATGAAAIPNGFGITVFEGSTAQSMIRIGGTNGLTPGGPCTGDCNLISGNTNNGVNASSNTVVQGNFIGTNVSGTGPIGNGAGVELAGPVQVGGPSAAAGNLISGNTVAGIQYLANMGAATIQGNKIGTNALGTLPVPNGIGIHFNGGGAGTVIGGPDPGARNLISGNATDGIRNASQEC